MAVALTSRVELSVSVREKDASEDEDSVTDAVLDGVGVTLLLCVMLRSPVSVGESLIDGDIDSCAEAEPDRSLLVGSAEGVKLSDADGVGDSVPVSGADALSVSLVVGVKEALGTSGVSVTLSEIESSSVKVVLGEPLC